MSNFDPPPDASAAFRNLFGQPEISPLGRAGNSHFGYVNPNNVNTNGPGGWHISTDIPGMGQGVPIRDVFDLGK
jgi:hypothetical protein